MTGHAAACVEKYLELFGLHVKSLPKVTHPCIDDHQLTEVDYQTKGKLHASAARIVLKCIFCFPSQQTRNFMDGQSPQSQPHQMVTGG